MGTLAVETQITFSMPSNIESQLRSQEYLVGVLASRKKISDQTNAFHLLGICGNADVD
jgi:hypothetical protein